jgi:hypothetical protein
MNFIKDILNNLKILLGNRRLDESLSKEVFIKGLTNDTSSKIDYKNLIVKNNMIEHVYPPEPWPNPNQSVVEVGLDYNISNHLTYGMCVSTQHRDKIQKNFDEGKQYLDNMKIWANTIYEPIIEILGVVPSINSMFRCPTLNNLVGGQLTSQHMDAEAGDTTYGKMLLREVYNKLAWSKIPFSQIIIEFESWIHIGCIDQTKHPGKVGQRFITGKDGNGNTIYIPVTKPFKI